MRETDRLGGRERERWGVTREKFILSMKTSRRSFSRTSSHFLMSVFSFSQDPTFFKASSSTFLLFSFFASEESSFVSIGTIGRRFSRPVNLSGFLGQPGEQLLRALVRRSQRHGPLLQPDLVRVGEHHFAVVASLEDDALLVLHLDQVRVNLLDLVHEGQLRLAVLRVELEPVGVELRVPGLPGRSEGPALLLDVAVQDAVRVPLVGPKLLLLGLLLALDLVVVVIDGVEDGVGHLRLPPLGYD